MGRIASLFGAQSITLPQQQLKQMLALDHQFEALESKVKALEAENLKLRAQVNPLKKEVERLKKQVQKGSSDIHSSTSSVGLGLRPNVLFGRVCDHCGSDQLKRTGSRPDPIGYIVGIKQAVYKCTSCGKESVF